MEWNHIKAEMCAKTHGEWLCCSTEGSVLLSRTHKPEMDTQNCADFVVPFARLTGNPVMKLSVKNETIWRPSRVRAKFMNGMEFAFQDWVWHLGGVEYFFESRFVKINLNKF